MTMAAAVDTDARSEVIATVRRLPNGRYATMRDVWEYLEDVPVEATSVV